MISVYEAPDISWDGTYNAGVLKLYADNESEITGQIFDTVKALQGSTCTACDTGADFMIDSTGTWHRLPSRQTQIILPDVYDKTDVDTLLDSITDDITDIQNLDAKQTLALVHIINEGGKNKVLPTATSQTVNGITWTVNADGIITASGTATANSFITIQVLVADSVFDGNYFLSGCPEGGSASTYALYVARGSYTRYDYGDGVVLSSSTDGLNKNLLAIIYSGQTVNDLVFRPMICKKVYWDITQKFVPYCPTLPEIYALVKSYHP